MTKGVITKTTKLAMTIVEKYLEKGDIVVDATAGNGHDTLALANLVGETGKVYAFDIQKDAIEKTRNLLAEYSYFNNQKIDQYDTTGKNAGALSVENDNLQVVDNVMLICDSHEKIADYVEEKGQVSAVLFNLGYLPSGDKSISTTAKSSTKAIGESLKTLKKGGMVSIVMYPGTEIGKTERDAVLSYAQNLPHNEYHVCYCNFPNQPETSPEILLIEVKTAPML